MLILAVDTSTLAGSLAVLRGEASGVRVLGVVSTHVDETYSSRMFRHLDFLLRELALEVKQFDLYAVAAGPGSFTGLRVGLTAVKGWAEAYAKPTAPVSALEAVAAQVRPETAGLVAAVIDARRGQVYGGLFAASADGVRRRGDEVVMAPGEFLDHARAESGGEPLVFATPTPEALSGALEPSALREARVECVSHVLAPVLGRLGYDRARRGETVDALHLDANYVRRSDAELLWRAPRHSKAAVGPAPSRVEGKGTP
jgi:tRNA threonylcarbamoyladenosine biosynthesis protein TsaB